MNVYIDTIKNLRTLVANSQKLNIGFGVKSPQTVANWIMNAELSYMNSQIISGGDEQATEILKVVSPILKEANKIGYEMDGLPDSTVFQAKVLWCVADTISTMCNNKLN